MEKIKIFLCKKTFVTFMMLSLIFSIVAWSVIIIWYSDLKAKLSDNRELTRYIIQYDDDVVIDSSKIDYIDAEIGAYKIKPLQLIKWAVVYIASNKNKADIINTKWVKWLFKDAEVSISGKQTPPPPEQIPWWIQMINSPLSWTKSRGENVKIAVFDTWIDIQHPDLKSNIKWWYNAINPSRSAIDDNWHWTHVAWTIWAIDNDIWVVWVAPSSSLYSVKVLDRNWNWYVSDIIYWLDWAIHNNMQVINMSLSTTSNIPALQEAINKALSFWIIIVAASGNDWWNVAYPAAYNWVIWVSAIWTNKSLAPWSNKWPEIDLTAPWVSIYSTFKWWTYKYLSGTSMASPHVAWTVALMFKDFWWSYSADLINKLFSSAEDLWLIGKDSEYWYWLVNSLNAIQ